MKRTPLKRGTKQMKRSGFAPKGKNATRKRKKTSLGVYRPPAWFNAIKPGSHGNTPAQKRYWKVISDTYREEDFKKYNRKCVSCGTRLEHWKDGDLAHFKKYSVCHSWFKYERKNVALSCKGCNQRDDGVVGYYFGEELKRRHGDHIIEWIEKVNEAYRGQKIETWELVEKTAKLRPDLVY